MFSLKSLFSAEKKSVSQVRSPTTYSSLYRGNGGSTYAVRPLPISVIMQNYTQIAPLYAAISRLADSVASLPYLFLDPVTNVPDMGHKVGLLLQKPNLQAQRIKQDFIRDYITWFVLHGNAYIMTTHRRSAGSRVSEVLEMFVLNSQYVSFEATNESFSYQPDSKASTRFFLGGDGFYYNEGRTQRVYHVKNFNIQTDSNDPCGTSEIASLFYELNHYIHSSQHNLGLLSNGARPSGAFMVKSPDGMPSTLSDEAFDSLQAQINTEYVGGHNAGKPLLLEGGLEWQEMSITPKDMDFTQIKSQAEAQIYRNLGIPTQLMSGEKTTSNNMKNIRLEFYENRVLPLADAFYSHLSNILCERVDYIFQVDRDEIDVLLDSRIQRKQSIANDMLRTINEKRKIMKIERIEGGDIITDPNGRIILGLGVENQTGMATDDTIQETTEQEVEDGE